MEGEGMKIETIHNSLINGQRTQMVDQIKEYGLYDFWSDYLQYLRDTNGTITYILFWYSDCVISYHRITNR